MLLSALEQRSRCHRHGQKAGRAERLGADDVGGHPDLIVSDRPEEQRSEYRSAQA